MKLKTKAIAPWFGSNRMLAHWVGDCLGGCKWVGIPFAGGLCEIPYFTSARTIVANDLHRHVINLARVVREPSQSFQLTKRLENTLYHPDTLREAQRRCRSVELGETLDPVEWAYAFFVCCWMTRSGLAGTGQEFSGNISTRWEPTGGDTSVRFRSATEGIQVWNEIFHKRNCTFLTMDVFDFLDKCKDRDKHGIYCDPPFPGVGRKYQHAPSCTDELRWHRKLRDRLENFTDTKIAVRYYPHPIVDELYGEWGVIELTGRDQNNTSKQERLFVRNMET